MIVFETVRYKNFLSTGNVFVEIPLNKHKTTLMVGKNGSGKSTILDAICFALFGKPFREINKPQLVNSINGKGCLVEIEFSIGTNKYLVRRGIKPNVFDIILNGNQLNKNADAMDYQKYLENGILKLNYKSFTQIVILGSSSFVPFMQLTAADRRVVVEDILDITIFSSVNSVLKERISILKDDIKKTETQIEVVKAKLEVQQEHIERLYEQNRTSQDTENQKTNQAKAEIEHHTKAIEQLQQQIDCLSSSISDKESVLDEIKKIDKIKIQGAEKKESISLALRFYENHDDCPECKQSIDSDFKSAMIADKTGKIGIIESALAAQEAKMVGFSQRMEEIGKVVDEVKILTREIQAHSTEIVSLNRYLDSASAQVIDVDCEVEKATALQSEYDSLLAQKGEMLEQQKLYDIANMLLKDTGIKAKVIKQYLPTINTLINKYLTDLNFYVSFQLDENFKEEIKSRNRDLFGYGSFSEGQKTRIDLAMLFTWREIAKMKNSVNTNLLFLDEIFDGSLDVDGTDDFMKLLKSVQGTHNVFLISHKTDQLLDKFNSVIQFEMRSNFTTMKVAR